ncbi:MAG: TVP38/TMEM64 family protein [Gemmatimonadaceae bacterium]
MERSTRRTRIAVKAPPARAALVRLGALALILVVVAFLGYQFDWFDPRHTLQHVATLRATHGIGVFSAGFVLAFGIAAALGVPGLPLTVIAGVLFGTVVGSALSWVGGMLGAVGGYWIACTIGRDVVTRWLKRFERVDNAIADSRDFTGMLRLRLIPILPLGVTNFVGGLARAPFASYLGATAIGIIPSTVIYAYFADSFLEGVGKGSSTARISLIVASVLMILLSFVPRLFKANPAKRPRNTKRQRDSKPPSSCTSTAMDSP